MHHPVLKSINFLLGNKINEKIDNVMLTTWTEHWLWSDGPCDKRVMPKCNIKLNWVFMS